MKITIIKNNNKSLFKVIAFFMAITAYNLQFSSLAPTSNLFFFFFKYLVVVCRVYGTFRDLNMSQRNRSVYRSGAAALVVLRVEHMQSSVNAGVPRRLSGRQIHADHVPQVPRGARRCARAGNRGAHARLRFHEGPQSPPDRPGHRGHAGALVLVSVARDPAVARWRGAHVALRVRDGAVR